MSSKGKASIPKIIIVFLIIFTLVGTSFIGVFGLFDPVESSKTTPAEEELIGEDLESVVKDEKALKIIDVHENINNYIDKEITLEGYFLNLDENNKVFGIEFPLGKGKLSMASLVYEVKDENIIKDISDTDLVKAQGTIESFEEDHEDHKDTFPKFIITSIEKIR